MAGVKGMKRFDKNSILICKKCNEESKRTSPNQQYCKRCSKENNTRIVKEFSLSPRGRWNAYKNSAKARSHEFTITFEEFMEYWQSYCTYCGDQVETIGLDRVDNLKGYSVDNIVSCCSTCNYMKQGLSAEDFFSHIQKIERNF